MLPRDAAPAPRSLDCRGLRVLLAEDNVVNRLLATRLLSKLGCEVTCAENGAEAVAKWTSGTYDVVLMDCFMPEVDGFEATAQIRAADERGRAVPIVALTASALDEDRERCVAAGMTRFLTKPVEPDKLEAALLEAK